MSKVLFLFSIETNAENNQYSDDFYGERVNSVRERSSNFSQRDKTSGAFSIELYAINTRGTLAKRFNTGIGILRASVKIRYSSPMLDFPRFFDMFEMKRPQYMGRFFDEDEGDFYPDNQAYQQYKQQRRIPVPVHHEASYPRQQQQQQYQRQYQPQQMPVPQPTGINAASSQPSNDTHQRQQRGREIPITVQSPERPRSQVPQMPQRSEPNITKEASKRGGMPMPQPHPSSNVPSEESFTKPEDTYTQPKPAAPKPKQQWVDPRITQALETIEKVDKEAQKLGSEADSLQVTTKDRTYLNIEEQLTKLLLKLDSIEAFGDDGVRSKRKACIRQVQQTLDALELKLEFS